MEWRRLRQGRAGALGQEATVIYFHSSRLDEDTSGLLVRWRIVAEPVAEQPPVVDARSQSGQLQEVAAIERQRLCLPGVYDVSEGSVSGLKTRNAAPTCW